MLKKILLTILLLLVLLLTRTYNLDQTARFTRDESSDLEHMHSYYKDKKITLVGPISSDKLKVFGSLTYYMLMPFAIVGQFEPISPVYGTVFWGILTALLMIVTVRKLNKEALPYVVILAAVWYPLLESSRWAWNPNLVPFWIALGLWFYFRNSRLGFALAGLFLGLSFHNHYIALFATGAFVLGAAILLGLKHKWKEAALFVGGYIFAFIPFILFDLRHPPGLFFNRYLLHTGVDDYKYTTVFSLAKNIGENIHLFFFYLTQNDVLAVLLGVLFLGLIIYDLDKNKKGLLFFVPIVAQIVGASLIETPATRYILPAVLFAVIWTILPRKKFGAVLAKISLVVLVVGGLFSLYPQLHYSEVHPDLTTISKVDHIIADTVKSRHLKDVNIATVLSPDFEPTGLKYRDMLHILGVTLRASTEYDATYNLFVISTASEKALRKGNDFALTIFKSSPLRKTFPIENTAWKVYWFQK